jgi:hypothetical protein
MLFDLGSGRNKSGSNQFDFLNQSESDYVVSSTNIKRKQEKKIGTDKSILMIIGKWTRKVIGQQQICCTGYCLVMPVL